MLVFQGTTPKETQDSIVQFLRHESMRFSREAKSCRLKIEITRTIARARALENAANDIEGAALSDLNMKPSNDR